MQIELQRTFGKYTEPQCGEDDDWHEYFGLKQGRLTWKDLHQKRVVVVLGEAGIGKTVEFQLEAKRLNTAGRHAFFLPLNLLQTKEDWQLALCGSQEDFTTWEASTEDGFFFLDAVDEARLQSHADFTRALWIVRGSLAPHMARVRIAISSRVTDWTVPEVTTSVADQLLQPINEAVARAYVDSPEVDEATPGNDSGCSDEELFVTTLDALTREEARRCGRHFGLQDEVAFWKAVDDGDYDFMASRPLDLHWMVTLWNHRKALGTYTELIEANIGARLSEVNPNYQQAGKVLSEAQFRIGATELAATAEFGGYSFIAVQKTRPPEEGVLAAHTVLPAWNPADIQLLLATAIFDEASFGRVKFHHRSIREYLAARWVDEKLTRGVPLGRLEPLFAGRPFGDVTLIPSRRPVLSWLAAINVRARTWVVSKFPELLLYEGDPQSWDQPSADLAFSTFIAATKTSPRIRWFRSASECLRVSRALGPGQLALVLKDASTPAQAQTLAYQLARHGKVEDCADVALAIYQDGDRQEWERTAALAILEVVGSQTHRAQVLADIESSAISGNQLIAHALPCIDWSAFTSDRLAAIFGKTQSEGEYGSGPMAQAVKDVMLPGTDLGSGTLLLTAILESLPRPTAGKPFARFPVENQPERAWLLDVLPDCFERVLDLSRETGGPPLQACLDAAERIEALRDCGFTDRDEFRRLHAAIKALPALRWDIALAIAHSEDIRLSTGRLVWGDSCIVTFDAEDLPELTRRANDSTLPPADQGVWFEVGTEVAFRLRRGRERASALRPFFGSVRGSRSALILEKYKQWLNVARTRRGWEGKQRAKEAKRKDDFAKFKASFLSKRASIADGSDFVSLRRLVYFAFDNAAWSDSTGVDLEAITSLLGIELATAFVQGLRSYWKKVTPPNPSDYPNGGVPWEALVAMSGVSLSASDGMDFARLSPTEVTAAAQIAAWVIPGPPTWLEPLYKARTAEVETALNPWVLHEAKSSQPGNGVRGALVIALRCPSSVRRGLLSGITSLLLSGAVTNETTIRELIPALYDDGLLLPMDFDAICQSALGKRKTASGRIQDLAWLQLWATARPREAWDWFRGHLSTLSSEKDLQASDFAAAMSGLTWVQQPWGSAAVELLLEVYEVLRQHGSSIIPEGDTDSAFFGPPIERMAEGIARGLVRVKGMVGRQALLQLIATENDAERQWNLRGLLAEHAEHEAAAISQWTIERLYNVHRAFDSEPRNEAQLYDQILARLEEIRTSVEEGPFSERVLFYLDMPEKFLQLWLAAKFQDTQNLRFSVHREEEVDDGKRTDIQLACAAAKVCVEIKPLDRKRSYSATSLVEDTIKRQLVGQYLKGRNSSRGILVLMQLDDKQWKIPNLSGLREFDELVAYLQNAADQIKLSKPGVVELHVFGIRCTN